MKITRILVPTVAAALLVAGCSSDPEPTANPEVSGDCVAAGDASEAVEVSGDFGGPIELTSDLPVEATELQRSVLLEGDGEELEDGVGITGSVSMFNGTSGELMDFSPGVELINSEERTVGWAHAAIRCSVVGQRETVTVPAAEAFGENAANFGFDADDTLIVIVDVTGLAPTPPGTLDEGDLLDKAEGEAQEAPAGLPEVSLAEDGEPTITIPEGVEAPTELTIATLIEGEGEEVQDGDRVYVHYRGVIWRTGEEFDSSWSRGSYTDFLTTGVIGGFQQALVGQKVGSQVISVVPADREQGGYGPDTLVQQGHEADDVMVFVLDILGTSHAG